MVRLLATAAIAALAILVARILTARRARGASPVSTNSARVPTTLDRQDFTHPERDWLVAVFTSATCRSCQATLEKARPLESPSVAFQEVEVVRDHELHERYHIDAVPTLLIADDEGDVRCFFLGPVTSADLWSAMAEVREPPPAPPSEVSEGPTEGPTVNQ